MRGLMDFWINGLISAVPCCAVHIASSIWDEYIYKVENRVTLLHV
jgi:hypothetical protein